MTMRIRINLLPPRERRLFLPERKIALLLLAVFVGALAIAYAVNAMRLLAAERALREAEWARQLLYPVLERRRELLAREREIAAKEAVLIRLSRERLPAAAVLIQLGALPPQDIRLTEIALDETRLVHIKGRAGSYDDAAAYLRRLEETHWFVAPVLRDLAVVAPHLQEERTIAFEITAGIGGPGP